VTGGRTSVWEGRSFGSSDSPLAAVHDVALLDLDGVVYVGPSAVPHAAEALDEARVRHAMRAAFVTNNAARTPAAVAAHLVELGIPARASDVVTSAQAGARVLAEGLPPGSRVLVIGGPGVGEALRERGLVPVESVDDGAVALIQGHGPDTGWRQLAEGSLAIGRGLLWVATNLDRTIPGPRGRVLGNGSMVAALRHATGAEPVVAGKPEPPLMHESVERSAAVTPLVVGDRLDTDIEGATRSGIPSLLVLTGVTDWQDLLVALPQHRPTYLGRDLRAVLEPAPQVVVSIERDAVAVTCGFARVGVPTGTPASAGSTRPDRGGAGGLAPDTDAARWWIPEGLRAAGPGDPGPEAEADLDVVRALVAAAWAIDEADLVVVGPAQVHAATR
jgi:HAD superfamily hydrolase (TIGR01450 family)